MLRADDLATSTRQEGKIGEEYPQQIWWEKSYRDLKQRVWCLWQSKTKRNWREMAGIRDIHWRFWWGWHFL